MIRLKPFDRMSYQELRKNYLEALISSDAVAFDSCDIFPNEGRTGSGKSIETYNKLGKHPVWRPVQNFLFYPDDLTVNTEHLRFLLAGPEPEDMPKSFGGNGKYKTMRDVLAYIIGKIQEIKKPDVAKLKRQKKPEEEIAAEQEKLPDLEQQLVGAAGIFKVKERKIISEQIVQTEGEIPRRLDSLPAIVQAEGYPDVQAFTATYLRQRPSWASITGSWPSGRERCRSASGLPGATHPGHREVSGSIYGGCRPRADSNSHSHAGGPLIGTADDINPCSCLLHGLAIFLRWHKNNV